MSYPKTVALPDFNVADGFLFVARIGTDDVLGQVSSINHGSSIPARRLPRLGDTNKYTTFGSTEHQVSLEMYTDLYMGELSVLLGGDDRPSSASGFWAGTEEIRINPSATPIQLYIDVYSANTGESADLLMGTWALVNFKATQLQTRIQADNPAMFSISATCDDIFYQPNANA